MSKYSYVELVFESQRVDIINNNQFQTTITFRGTGDQSKLLSVIISSYNRIKNDLYHGIHNFSLYQNDINKISDNGKFYKEINILESEISNPIKLLLKIFNKVTTTNLINNTDNYNEMSEGTFSTKLFTTQIKNIKSSTSVTTTVNTTSSLLSQTGNTTTPVTTTVTSTSSPLSQTGNTTTPPKPSNTAAEATGGAIGGGLATAKVAVTILKKKPIPTRNISTVTIERTKVGYLDTETGNFVPASASDVTEEVASKIFSGEYVPLYQFKDTTKLGSAYFNNDMQMFALEMDESLKLVERVPSKLGNPLYKYVNPENGNEIFALDQNASPSPQLYANLDGENVEISPVVNSSGEEASVNGDTLYKTTDGEYVTLNNDGTVTLNDQGFPQQYANVNGEYVAIDPVGNSTVKGDILYKTANGEYVTFNEDGTVKYGLTGDPATGKLTVTSVDGAVVDEGVDVGSELALGETEILLEAGIDLF